MAKAGLLVISIVCPFCARFNRMYTELDRQPTQIDWTVFQIYKAWRVNYRELKKLADYVEESR